MTLLATVARKDFAISIADRRLSAIANGEIIDSRFNKHIFFGGCGVKVAITYAGWGRWHDRTGQPLSTDKLIGDALADCASRGTNLGVALTELAHALDFECDLFSKRYNAVSPYFTVHLVGFTELFSEPVIALITDSEPAPLWNEDQTQFELAPVGRFRIYLSIRGRPCLLWSGNTRHLPTDTIRLMTEMLHVQSIQAFDVANFAVSRIRQASKTTSTIGSRVSAIIAPANGSLDTGIWSLPDEQTLGVMPRIVWPNGTQWEPSEVQLDLASFIPGKLQRHSIMYRSLISGKVPRRVRRRLERITPEFKTPTIMEIIMFALFGKHWDE